MALLGTAALAMWWQLTPGVRDEFEHWHSHEHFPERLALPGFRRASRWIDESGAERVFVLYELDDFAVLSSAPYLERLNAPTPWSQRLMPHHRQMVRGQCRVLASRGTAVARQALTVRLSPEDFEVERTEHLVRSSTVLMLDLSLSMPMRDNFLPAKKVALALHALLRSQFPRDTLHILGFSLYARTFTAEQLPGLSWSEWNIGTNMHHGFQIARQLLGRHKGPNKQVIMITDGEPTAHMEGGEAQFAYPPTRETFQETLKEVERCTREGITINTFMLEESRMLMAFVEQMARINRGRAFFAAPDRLGEYILVDYVRNKRHAS